MQYRILIVEDSPTMRQLIVFALKRVREFVIDEAGDGVDGLKKLSNTQYDLIMTDINMPIMDGLKLVSLVRSDPGYRDVPIVIISTEGAEEDRDRAFALGANEYITKPVQPTKVLQTARRLLGLKP